MQRNWGKAIIAGLVATLVMTAVGLWVAPMMGIPAMNPAQMLAGAMGGSIVLGWMGHLMIGVILAIGYVRAPAGRGMRRPVPALAMRVVLVLNAHDETGTIERWLSRRNASRDAGTGTIFA
jgi:hypothetical protein